MNVHIRDANKFQNSIFQSESTETQTNRNIWSEAMRFLPVTGKKCIASCCMLHVLSAKCIVLHVFKPKIILGMHRVTWPGGRGSKVTTYFGIPDPKLPIHFTIFTGLLWWLRVVYSWASPLWSILVKNFRPKMHTFCSVFSDTLEKQICLKLTDTSFPVKRYVLPYMAPNGDRPFLQIR